MSPDRGGAPRYINDLTIELIACAQGQLTASQTAIVHGVDRRTVRDIWGGWRPVVRRMRVLDEQPDRIRFAACRR